MNTIFVIFEVAAGGRGPSIMEFTVLEEAKRCAQEWLELPSAYESYLWDGQTWTVYS